MKREAIMGTYLWIMTNEELIIRPATKADIASLSELMNELGYPTTPEEMDLRFRNIENHADYKTLVAISGGKIAGMIGAMKSFYYEYNGTYIRILALVTGSIYRKLGIGEKLLASVESWAREINAMSLVLTCGNREERKEAHRFYQDRGFAVKSSGYVKKL